jgi:Arc/MetJ-type ribon-helix-helix transcriptional regulator
MTHHHHTISRLRDGTRGRDLAILDALHLQELGLVPGRAPVKLLETLWRVSQSQVSRRMAAVAELGLFMVRSDHGRYLLVELSEHRRKRSSAEREQDEQAEQARWDAARERWEAARRQLQQALG